MAVASESRVETGSVVVDGTTVFYRRIAGDGPPAVFVHGVPDHSEQWTPFLERMRGPALAFDLPGFGRSDRPPPERFDYGVDAHARFVERALERLGVEDHSLVVHDWGGLALISAQRAPARLRRLVAINCVPLLPGYRWHRTARIWRTPWLGEISNRLWTRRIASLALRESRGDWSAPPPAFVDMIWDQLDAGTFAAILRLYRSAPEEKLARLGAGLGALTAPALVVWSGKDRYLPARFGRAYAAALPNAELVELPALGHWPWLEDATVVDRVVAFLEQP
ncbi:MAG TPA: alpha/beta hydrolase [Solirubrobacterales bacterium]|jgi:pimeloyl-ACP methyl ester carboxylesterase|nr:alpha/beta hydrolase [Solirubrobacterales bacterium]